MIQLDHVSKLYFGKRALDSVSLVLEQKNVIGLAGENGSGKTTLLKTIAGLLSPDVGVVRMDGEKLTRRAAYRIAYMADVDLFYPNFSTRQLFHFYSSQFPDFDNGKAEELVEFLKLPWDTPLGRLSKGNRGRAKIAATLAREADYYLLDEPFAGLDPMVREDIGRGLIRFTDPARQAILLSTHEISEVEPLLDELIVMKEGSIIGHQQVDEIRDHHGMDASSWMKSLFV